MQYRDEPVLSFRPIDAKESKPQNVRRLVRLQIFIAVVLVALIAMLLVLCYLIRPVRIKSDAMSPTYKKGCVVFVTREWGVPERGEIAAFTDPSDGSGEIYVRRVVAVEGDSVEIRNGVLYVNGKIPYEDYLEKDLHNEYPNLAETTVPAGYVFVLGDNRSKNGEGQVAAEVGQIDVRSILGVVRFSLGR